MNKYKTYTDKQINNVVAHKLGKKFVTIIGDDVRISGYNFDPCNNPADAMPIVIENKITMAYDSGSGFWCAHSGGVMDECCWDYEVEPMIFSYSESYYRAAMEVFLMMNGAENDLP